MAGASRSVSKLPPDRLYEYALRALGRRSHTSAELRFKLVRRSVAESDVEAVLARLRRNGYLDDESVAASHSEFRRDYARIGQRRVLSELRRRGVDSSVAERVVEGTYADADEASLARDFLCRKLGLEPQHAKIEGPRELQRLYGALARAGFEPDVITDALREVAGDGECLDALADLDGCG